MLIQALRAPDAPYRDLWVKENPLPCSLNIARNVLSWNGCLFLEDRFISSRKYYNILFQQSYKSKNDFPPKGHRHITRPTLFVSHYLDQNYSHFTTQCLGSFFQAGVLNVLAPSLQIAARPRKSFHRQIFDFFGLDKYPLLNLEDNVLYYFDTVYYCTTHFDLEMSEQYLAPYEKLTHKLKLRISPKIYITRLYQPNRKCVNEKDVIEHMRTLGFDVVDFDSLPVVSQIILTNSASIICAPHGASGANLAYRRHDERFKFIELFSSNLVSGFHVNLLVTKNCDYSATINKTINSDSLPGSPYRMDLNILDKALNENCYIFNGIAADYNTWMGITRVNILKNEILAAHQVK